MLRVLQVVNIMDRAGLESMLMNYYRNIDREKVQFDFVTTSQEPEVHDEEALTGGGRSLRIMEALTP